MFDIGWSELLVLAVVALLVVGPKELPSLMRTIGAFINKVKETAGTFQRQFQTALEESEVGELKTSIDELSEQLAPHELMSEITGQSDFYDEFDEDEWDAAALARHENAETEKCADVSKTIEPLSGGSAGEMSDDEPVQPQKTTEKES